MIEARPFVGAGIDSRPVVEVGIDSMFGPETSRMAGYGCKTFWRNYSLQDRESSRLLWAGDVMNCKHHCLGSVVIILIFRRLQLGRANTPISRLPPFPPSPLGDNGFSLVNKRDYTLPVRS